MAVTVDMLESFLRQPPPRHVPSAIRKKAQQRVPSVLLLIGFMMVAMGIPFAGIFVPKRLPDDIRLSRRGEETQGTVIRRERTTYTENNARVMRYVFRYKTPDGPHDGVCYSSTVKLDAGANVTVVYLPDKPAVARIKGCRLSPFGWGASFLIIVPAIGLILLLFGIRSRKQIRSLLKDGQFAMGQISDIKTTMMQVNKQQVYRIFVRYETGRGEKITATYHVIGDEGVRVPQQKMTVASPIGVLYDATNPKRIILVDDLLG